MSLHETATYPTAAKNLNSGAAARRGTAFKVCYYSNLYAPIFSGEAIQVHLVVQALQKLGLHGFVLTGLYDQSPAEEVIDGVRVKRIRAINTDLPFIRPLSLAINLLPALYKNRREFDILELHSIGMFDFLLLLFAKLLKKKTIIKVSLMGSPNDPATWPKTRAGRLRQFTFFYQWSFALADKVVSLSRPISEGYLESGLEAAKLCQIPQGVETDRFYPVSDAEKRALREKLKLPKDGVILSFVGSFKQRKGADILVKTFIQLAKRRPDLDLLVVGPDEFDDPIRVKRAYDAFSQGLKESLERAGLAGRVHFTGMVQNVEEYLQAADIFMFPSRREGFGAAIIEAMAAGLPCVLAEIGGISAEISAEGETARIIHSESSDEYSDAIAALLDSPAERRGLVEAAGRRIEEEYSMDVVCARYLQLYVDLIG